jgi:hypothetical protein
VTERVRGLLFQKLWNSRFMLSFFCQFSGSMIVPTEKNEKLEPSPPKFQEKGRFDLKKEG